MTMPSMCKKVVVFDLDDTLYKEIDFLKSGYRKVAELVEKRFRLTANDVYYNLLSWYSRGENAFAKLNETYSIDNPIKEYIDIYRYHQPSIVLSEDTKAVLTGLQEAGILMGIISDGRVETQNNKYNALGLSEWISPDLVLINEEQKYFKPNHWSFDRMMLKCFEKGIDTDAVFYYVADNPKKDFLAPNQLGWKTICLKDDGRNIHKQELVHEAYMPQITILGFGELLNTIR